MEINQEMLNIAIGVILSVLGWFSRELWGAVKDLKTDLAKLREDIPKQYVGKDDYREDTREIKEMLSKIFDRLDKKVDRS